MYYSEPVADTATVANWMKWISNLGTLRLLMMLVAVMCIAAAPFANGATYTRDWRLLPTVIAPSIMMMLVFAIPLDVCMARIFMTAADLDEQARLRHAIYVELVVLVALVLAWTPFMLKVMDFWPFA